MCVERLRKKLVCFVESRDLPFTARLSVYNSIIAPHFDTNISMMLNALKPMSVRQRFLFNALKLIFKIKHKIVPEYLTDRVVKNNVCHRYGLRNIGDFRLPLYKKACTQRMLLYEGMKSFNNLPHEVKSESNVNAFT